MSVVFITEYTHTPLLSLNAQKCPITIRTRLALRESPEQDPTKYTTISDVPWGYTNNAGARIVNLLGSHKIGPLNLPSEGTFGAYAKPTSSKNSQISFLLSTDVSKYGYKLDGVRYRTCNMSGELCKKHSKIIGHGKKSPSVNLVCNKTLEYEWVLDRQKMQQ